MSESELEKGIRAWQAREGPQKRFLECGANEACMGGIVGGGKSSALLVGALRHVPRPGYAAGLFRRNYTELTKPDGLIERAAAIYRAVGGESRDGGKKWFWQTGARIDLEAMDREDDRFNFEGSAYQYIAFDELQTFARVQFIYMYTRRRQNALTAACPIPLRTRSSATPGGLHSDWVLERYSPWIRAKDPLWKGPRAEDGQRLFYRLDERSGDQVLCKPSDPGARSRAFFATEMLEEVGQAYRENLSELDPITRAQREFGNWLVRPGAGLFFTDKSFEIVDTRPQRVRTRCRGWDLASTPKKPRGAEETQAATAGVRMALDAFGDVWIEDVKREWLDPMAVEDLIARVAEEDDEDAGAYVRVSVPLDPGQAARHQRESYVNRLRGHDFHMTPEVGEKTNRIKPLSAHAARRPIKLVRGEWNEAYMRELIGFPYGLKDQGDASSRAYAECLHAPSLIPSRDENRPPRRETARGFGGY